MGVLSRMREDIQSIFDRDPAARTTLEVVLLYPGLHAIWAYRARTLALGASAASCSAAS